MHSDPERERERTRGWEKHVKWVNTKNNLENIIGADKKENGRKKGTIRRERILKSWQYIKIEINIQKREIFL